MIYTTGRAAVVENGPNNVSPKDNGRETTGQGFDTNVS